MLKIGINQHGELVLKATNGSEIKVIKKETSVPLCPNCIVREMNTRHIEEGDTEAELHCFRCNTSFMVEIL